MPATQISRNQPCPCGSGKRYKHCCGVESANAATTPAVGEQMHAPVSPVTRPDLPTLMQRALGCQKQGRLADAEALYREALALAPANFDALHMLGVVRLQLGEPEGGARLILDAIRTGSVEYPPLYANLLLCLAAIARRRGIFAELPDAPLPASERPRIHFAGEIAAFAGELPLVSVVMPPDSGGDFVAETLESVCGQSYRNLELVVAQEWQGDTSTGGIAAMLAACSLVTRCAARENTATRPTLNECVSRAQGQYVALLTAGDAYEPDRIELMTRMLSMSGSRWGFSGIRFTDVHGRRLRYGDNAAVDTLMRRLDEIHGERPVTAALMQFNHALASGNLVCEKRLWDELGGFHEDCADPCWDFCVRASLAAAPAILFEPKYVRRIRDAETASDVRLHATPQAGSIQAYWRSEIRKRLKDQPERVRRILAAQYLREWRLFETGQAREIEPAQLVGMTETLLDIVESHG